MQLNHSWLEFSFFKILTTMLLVWLLLPIATPLIWGAVLAVIGLPIYHFLLNKTGHKQILSALLATAAISLVFIIPTIFLVYNAGKKLSLTLGDIREGKLDIKEKIGGLSDSLELPEEAMSQFDLQLSDLTQKLGQVLSDGSVWLAESGFSIGQSALAFAIYTGITIYLLFYFLKDGQLIIRKVRSSLSIPSEISEEIIQQMSRVIHATIKGNLFVATIQGCLGGLCLWFLGFESIVLWTSLMIACALIPAIGSGIVWIPLSIYLFAQGDISSALILIAFGATVIGLSDNFLRPLFVGKNTFLPTYLIFVATIGGLTLFGVNGFVIGPMIATLGLLFWDKKLLQKSEERL